MEYSSAEMVCVLKVNTQCEACKVKMMQILNNIRGVYSIILDGEQGTVKVTGRVNPSTLLGVLEKHGRHAELKYARFDGEVAEKSYCYYGDYGYNPYVREYPCPLMARPQHQWYETTISFFPPPPLPPPPPQASFWAAPPPPPPLAPFWPPPPPPPYARFRAAHPFGHVPRGPAPKKLKKEHKSCRIM